MSDAQSAHPVASIVIDARLTTRRLGGPVLLTVAMFSAACGTDEPGVGTSRADRTITTAEPIAPATTGESEATTITAPAPSAEVEAPTDAASSTTTTTSATTAPEPPPAPAASGPGSASADDLANVFIPVNPDLLGASNLLLSGVDPSTFIDESLTFTGLPPAISIAGAPITTWSYVLVEPTFDGDTVSDAAGITVRYRMAVEVEVQTDDIDDSAELLREALRPIVEAANPGEEVRDTVSDAVLGNKIFGLAVGPADLPTTQIEIEQHYVVVPRLVNEEMLAVRITRRASDVLPEELPGLDFFVDDALQAQIDLVGTSMESASEPNTVRHVAAFTIPSAGSPSVNRFVEFDYPVSADGFEPFVDGIAEVLDTAGYITAQRFGDTREFESAEERIDEKFFVERNGEASVLVGIQGDRVAYP